MFLTFMWEWVCVQWRWWTSVFPPSLPTSARSSMVVVKMMTMGGGFGMTDKPLHRNSWFRRSGLYSTALWSEASLWRTVGLLTQEGDWSYGDIEGSQAPLVLKVLTAVDETTLTLQSSSIYPCSVLVIYT